MFTLGSDMRLSMVLVLLTATPAALLAAERPRSVTVHAGEFDRIGTIVSFDAPTELIEEHWVLTPEAGAPAPIQIAAGRASFRIDELKAGEARTYALQKMPQPTGGADSVTMDEHDGVITASIGGQAALRYQGEESPLPDGYDPALQRGGYIHPVFTPSGKLVTDDYPPNHKHHHGIWAPWTKTEFEGRKPDFWNMGEKTGTVEFVSCGQVWSGPVAGGFTAQHQFIDLTAQPRPKAALNERWDVVVSRGRMGDHPAHVVDLLITQTCATDSPLILPKYYYGGLGFRGHRQWDGPANAFFLTSEGKDRSNGNETSGRWCHIGGKIDGELAGVAILCHPDNFRFPQPMRLHPDEPFFCFAPSQGGDWMIEPGEPYVARYRFVVADGPAVQEEIDRLWNDYASPPKVELK